MQLQVRIVMVCMQCKCMNYDGICMQCKCMNYDGICMQCALFFLLQLAYVLPDVSAFVLHVPVIGYLITCMVVSSIQH